MSSVLAAESGGSFVDLHVYPWQWLVLLGIIVALLLVDLLVIHREAHAIKTKEAAIESAAWISIGVGFALVVWWWFGGQATGEYISGYLIEKSLSIDNVFVWALIMAYFKVDQRYQHRVLFWGIFGALVMRAVFIFAGVALIEAFDWILYVFGGFLLFTAVRMLVSGDEEFNPAESKFMRLVNRFVPSTDKHDGQKLFTRKFSPTGRLLATPLFAVLILIEFTDVIFAVDSVPAVLAVSRSARPLLPARRLARPLPLPADRPRGHPRLRRRQDDRPAGVRLPHRDIRVAGRHRPDPRRLDRGVAAVGRFGARRAR